MRSPMRPASEAELSQRLSGWVWRFAPMILAVIGGLMMATEAAARVGGGQGYSGGSSGGSSSSGGGYSGGGGSAEGDLIFFLIWLCFEHPVIGIPLLIVVAVVMVKVKGNEGTEGARYASHHDERVLPSWQGQANDLRRRVNARRRSLQTLHQQDPDFSESLFIDHVQLVYARAQTLRAEPGHPWLLEHLTPGAMSTLDSGGRVDAVEDVIFGATHLDQVQVQSQWLLVKVGLETNYTEVNGGKRKDLLAKEVWTLRRRLGVRSPGPEGMRSLGCASCGSTLEVTSDGRCPNCEAVRSDGAIQWQVHGVERQVQTLPPPRTQLGGGGPEAGVHAPTVVDPDLAVALRKLSARRPEFRSDAFKDRVRTVFLKLQEAWSEQRWELARPYETDSLFQVHRFWMERYRRYGLANRLGDVEVHTVEICKVTRDAWVETLTVRVHASMKDWMERLDASGRPTGKVVGGDPHVARLFSEYWTFLRTVGSDTGESHGDGVHSCPSCAAPLDQVSQTGVCGYCDSKITTGDYDWVLSRIEQDEAYVG